MVSASVAQGVVAALLLQGQLSVCVCERDAVTNDGTHDGVGWWGREEGQVTSGDSDRTHTLVGFPEKYDK